MSHETRQRYDRTKSRKKAEGRGSRMPRKKENANTRIILEQGLRRLCRLNHLN